MGRVLTLLYHRVNQLQYDKNLLAVSPKNFYDHMSYLKKNYPIVRFEQGWEELEGDAVCITFDDGYMDNFWNALPILEELDIPATIFVATGNINTPEELWWDELERILLDRQKEYAHTFSLRDDFFACEWPTGNFFDRNELYDTLHWLMYDKISVVRRKEWMRQLRAWKGTGSKGRKENQVLQTGTAGMDSMLLTIGAHTVNHPSLGVLSEKEQRYEIGQSVRDLKRLFHREIAVFSYPFGTKHDYDETTIEICREEKLRKAASNFPGIWTEGCDEYQIPRNLVRNWDINEFGRKLGEFWRQV